MPVTQENLRFYKSANMPGDDVSLTGGAITSNLLSSLTVGSWFPRNSAEPEGSEDFKAQHQKVFLKNMCATDGLNNGIIYQDNAIGAMGVSSVLRAKISNAVDSTGTTIRVCGINSSNVLVIEDIQMNGYTDFVPGTTVWKQSPLSIVYIMAVETNTGIPKHMLNSRVEIANIEGNIAYIPRYHYSAVGFVSLGIQATIGGETTIINRTEAPVGITFSNPRTVISAVSIGSSGIIPASSAIAIWGKQSLVPGFIRTNELELVVVVIGSAGGS